MKIFVYRCASLLALLLSGATASAGVDSSTLRVCADPDNLPFTREAKPGEPKGFYLDLADALGERMGRPVEVHWWRDFYAKRMLRATLLANRCDLFFGLPQGAELFGPRVIFSKPILDVGYVLALPPGAAAGGVDDLKGKKIAVQFGSPPQNALAVRDDVKAVTFLSAEAAMQAVADGAADAGYVWGPTAGYYNKVTLGGRFRFAAATAGGSGMAGKVGIGFTREHAKLRDEVDAQIDNLQPTIDRLKEKYGFPDGAETPRRKTEGQPGAPALKAEAVQTAKGAAPAADDARGGQGNSIFNNLCSHCHGPNGEAAERRVDLRRLKMKYGDQFDEVFKTTVENGRPSKGMPVWKDILSGEEFTAVKSYIYSLQKN